MCCQEGGFEGLSVLLVLRALAPLVVLVFLKRDYSPAVANAGPRVVVSL